MTDSNRLALAFSNLGRRRIQADFVGGKRTSDAGAALLPEVDRRIGLDAADAVPSLSELVAHHDQEISQVVAAALKKINPTQINA